MQLLNLYLFRNPNITIPEFPSMGLGLIAARSLVNPLLANSLQDDPFRPGEIGGQLSTGLVRVPYPSGLAGSAAP